MNLPSTTARAAWLAAALFTCGTLAAQDPDCITVPVGGEGTLGLQNDDDPPTLSDGCPATGEIEYCLSDDPQNADPQVKILEITVRNTTIVEFEVPNPVLSEVYFNIPVGGVTAMSFVSANDGGAFGSGSIDLDTTVAPNPNNVGGFGNFGVCHTASNTTGIANPLADTWGVDDTNLIKGDVTFVYSVTVIGDLSAADFAGAPTTHPPGDKDSVAAFKFVSGCQGGSGFIGTSDECTPGVWQTSDACIGQPLCLNLANPIGCHHCLIVSLDITPFETQWGLLPFSPPFYVWYGADSTDEITEFCVPIPNWAGLVGLQLGFMNLTLDDDNDALWSDGALVTIEDCAPEDG